MHHKKSRQTTIDLAKPGSTTVSRLLGLTNQAVITGGIQGLLLPET
jgi:hypothetical protein